MINFQKIFCSIEQKTLCKESILDICIPDGEKLRGLDKYDPIQNKEQMQSSFKDFERKPNEKFRSSIHAAGKKYILKIEPIPPNTFKIPPTISLTLLDKEGLMLSKLT